MEMTSLSASAFQDERSRISLLPTAVKLTCGRVYGASLLLHDAPTQAVLGYTGGCRLENVCGGEKAGLLLDYGRESHGTLRLTAASVESTSGRAKLRIRFGESVMEALTPLGQKNATNDHAVRDHVYDLGTLSTAETNESGFRFAYLELEEEEAVLTLQAVHHVLIIRDIPYLGSFTCDDPLLNEIWKTAAWTVHLNMQNFLWDGIKRDRLAWQGDMHTEVLTVEDVFGGNPVVTKTLDFLRDHTPAGEFINGYSSYSVWWVLIQAENYRYTGDFDYLQQQRDFLKAQLMLAASFVDEEGIEQLPQFRFLDWKNRNNEKATHAGLQALMVLGLKEGAYLLSLLDEKEQAAECLALSEKMKRHVPDCDSSKQAAALLSLAGLSDAEDLNRDIIEPGGAEGFSTFMGYYLLSAKDKAGDVAGALRDLRSYWGGMLRMGATSFWEDFDLKWMEKAGQIDEVVPEGKKDIHGDYGAFCYEKFRHSLCHGWSSGPVPFLMRHVAGISIAEPGCRKLRITPQLGDLRFVEAEYPTPLGIVHARHERKPDGSIESAVNAPAGIEYEIREEPAMRNTTCQAATML